jgi:hypothetical protein
MVVIGHQDAIYLALVHGRCGAPLSSHLPP